VIEAVPENLDLKLSIMKSLDQIVSPDTILASNTSAIPIAQLGGVVSNPERVVGLHFFSPVPTMKLVEIVRALDTSDETVAASPSSRIVSASMPSRRRTDPASSSTYC
jgi:3-hydroxybutyryl-CoA dehydrogenase